MNSKHDFWMVGDNKVKVYYIGPLTIDSNYIDGASLYGILRRGNWTVYITRSDPITIMLLEQGSVYIYKISTQELYLLLDYYCSNGEVESDWIQNGF